MTAIGDRIGRFFLWAYRLDEDFDTGEVLITDRSGSFFGRFLALKGRIILTNDRLIFRSNSLRPGFTDQVRISLEVHEILASKLKTGIPLRSPLPGFHVIELELASESLQFQMPHARAFLEALQIAQQPGILPDAP